MNYKEAWYSIQRFIVDKVNEDDEHKNIYMELFREMIRLTEKVTRESENDTWCTNSGCDYYDGKYSCLKVRTLIDVDGHCCDCTDRID